MTDETEKSTPETEDADAGRRGVFAALLGLGVAGLAACGQAAGKDREILGQAVGAATGASGAVVVNWADSIIGLVVSGARHGDLATNTAAQIDPSGNTVVVVAKGCLSAGDGGGGVFFWSTTSATDDGGTVIVPNVAGYLHGGLPGQTGPCWRRIYSGPLNVKWFGAKGDGVADDTAAINAAISAATATGANLFLPAGTYLTQGIDVQPAQSGLALYGEGPSGQWGSGTVLRLIGSSPPFLLNVQALRVKFSDLTFDGAGLPTLGVIALQYLCSECVFERVNVYGAIENTGALVRIPGTQEVDNIYFRTCRFQQSMLDGTKYAGACVYNTNTNAFQTIEFDGCHFSNAVDLIHFSMGSCNFRNVQFYNWTRTAFRIETLCQTFTVENFYSEQCALTFFEQVLNAAGTTNRPIRLINGELNADSPIKIICTQPVYIDELHIAGNVDVTPDATYGTKRSRARSVTFSKVGKGYTGSGVTSHLRREATCFITDDITAACSYSDEATRILGTCALTGTVGGAVLSNVTGGPITAGPRDGAGNYHLTTPSWPAATTRVMITTNSNGVGLCQPAFNHVSNTDLQILTGNASGTLVDGLSVDVVILDTTA